MKKLLLFFVLFAGVCQAQIVNIPNAAFKSVLVAASAENYTAFTSLDLNATPVVIDTNGNGQIEVSETVPIVRLNLEHHNLSAGIVGIQAFTNLVQLNLDETDVLMVDLSNMIHLKHLEARDNLDFASLNVSGAVQLETLICPNGELNNLNLTGLTNLQSLDVNHNSLTSINLALVPNLKNLGISYNQISTLNLAAVPHLEDLSCSGNLLTTLDVSPLSLLTSLFCDSNSLTSINLGTISNLSIFGCSYNHLSSLNLASMGNVTTLSCSDNQLSSLHLSALTNLQNLSCQRNQLTALDLSAQPGLEYLDCSYNQLATLNTQPLTNLGFLNIDHNGFSNIDLSPMTGLGHFNCSNNLFSSYVFPPASTLQEFYCYGNPCAVLDVAGLPNLEELRCGGPQLTAITSSVPNPVYSIEINESPLLTSIDLSPFFDLSHLSMQSNALQILDISHNPGLNVSGSGIFEDLVMIKAKNGYNGDYNSIFLPIPNVEYICADEEEIEGFSTQFPTAQVNTYCSFVPGGSNNSISGNILFDGNNNGCGSGDAPLLYTRFNIVAGANSGALYTNTTGNYTIYAQTGPYTVTPVVENGSYFIFSPASATINFPSVTGQNVMQSFCVTANGIHPDAKINMVPIGAARPGFDAHYQLVYKNTGNQVLNGNITLVFDDAHTDFVSATPTPANQSLNTLSWNYSHLQPFEVRHIELTINLNGPMEMPPLNDTDILDFNANLVYVIPDHLPYSTSAELHQIIVNSLDPNDKTCLEGNTISPDMIGDYVHYNINFENIGTAEAVNVVVKDVIDTTKFDLSTLQVIDASHPVVTRINGNIVEFIFENINLPGTSGENKGNVLFKIKTWPTLVLGNSISNQAEIFFDYNFPIETNEATSTFSLLKNNEFKTDTTIGIAPNPAKNKVNIKANSTLKSLQLFDVQGRILQTSIENSNETSMDISGKANGIYFLKVTSEKGSKVEKLVKE